MPIRQPNGIWIPTFSPASKSEVAPSISIALIGDREGDRAALAAFVGSRDNEPLHVQGIPQTRFAPYLLDCVEHGGRTARPCGPVLEIRNQSVESIEIEMAVCFGQMQKQS